MRRRADESDAGVLMREGLFIGAILLCLTLLSCTPHSAALVITVGGAGADFDRIQDALNRASAGDVVFVRSGVYEGGIVVNKGVVLRGETSNGVPLIQVSSGAGILVLGDRATIESIAVSCRDNGTGIRITSGYARVTGCYVLGCSEGILLEEATGALVSGNLVEASSVRGIALVGAYSSTITRNSVKDGEGASIYIDERSAGSLVYLNNFENQIDGVADGVPTSWHSPEPVRYSYLGKEMTGNLGNHWRYYAGRDLDGNGVGDTPYQIGMRGKGLAIGRGSAQFSGKRDEYPLITAWEALLGATPMNRASVYTPPAAIMTSGPYPIPPTTQGAGAATQNQPSEPFIPPLLAYPLCILLGAVAAFALYRQSGDGGMRGTGGYFTGVPALAAVLLLLTGAVLLALLWFFFDLFQSNSAGIPGLFILSLSAVLVSFILVSSLLQAKGVLTEGGMPLLRTAHLFCCVLFLPCVHALRAAYEFDVFFASVLLTTAIVSGVASFVLLRVEREERDSRTVVTAVGENREREGAERTYFPSELAHRYSEVTYAGSGGLARVFRARRRSDGAEVAVKIPISLDETTGKAFLKEMKIWEGLHHPNIVRVEGANILPLPYVEMEYIASTLADIPKPVPVAEAIRVARGIAEGLAYAHSRGVVHRDLKPGNILITPDGTPKIGDWGLSALAGAGEGSTLAGFSLPYAAPEQIAPARFGTPDARTDIYQLGAILYELLAGRPPFGGEDAFTTARSIVEEKPRRLDELDPALAPLSVLIMRCLEKDPDARYQSVKELLEGLERCTEGDGGR